MRNKLKNLFNKYFNDEKYIVEDITKPFNPKIIFILESPHNDEVKNGYPVAGRSGVDMAEFMRIGNEGKSLGEIAKSDTSFGINIINVCKVPLQPTSGLEIEYKEIVDKLDGIIRTGYKSFGKHNKNKDFNDIEEIILRDFKDRYEKINSNNSTLIVICGEFSKTYFDALKKENKLKGKVIYVPHPSRNKWKINIEGLLKLSEINLKNR